MSIKIQKEDAVCHWCGGPVGNSPYRTPIAGIPGARWIVCGPDCADRDADAVVFPRQEGDPWTRKR